MLLNMTPNMYSSLCCDNSGEKTELWVDNKQENKLRVDSSEQQPAVTLLCVGRLLSPDNIRDNLAPSI